MKFMKSLTMGSICVSACLSGAVMAADVEVVLSDHIQDMTASINRIEQKREKSFRKHRDDNRTFAVTDSRRMAKARWNNVDWASEQLIDDVSSYTLKNLTVALVNESLERAGVADQVGRVRVQIDTLRVSNHSLARLSGINNHTEGKIELWDKSGRQIASVDVNSNMVPLFTSSRSYDGPNFAFADIHEKTRIGPTLSYFIYKGLDKAMAGKEFPRPITVLYND